MPPQVGWCSRVAACFLCRECRRCNLMLGTAATSAAQTYFVCTCTQATALPASLPALCPILPYTLSFSCMPVWCQPLKTLALHALQPHTVLPTAAQAKRPPRVHELCCPASLVTLHLKSAFQTGLQTGHPQWRRHTFRTIAVHFAAPCNLDYPAGQAPSMCCIAQVALVPLWPHIASHTAREGQVSLWEVPGLQVSALYALCLLTALQVRHPPWRRRRTCQPLPWLPSRA